MADYRKMYSILCGAASDAIDMIEDIPLALPAKRCLQDALWKAEELYLDTVEPESKPALILFKNTNSAK